MRTALLCLAIALGMMAATAAPAAADHKTLTSSEPSGPPAPERSSVDVDLKLGANGFRIGARVFGKEGYTGGAWLNGETRPEGFSVDGRVEREGGRSWNFKLNADIDQALRQLMRGWWGGGLTDL
ncbi:MAG TPA: hypothetical protein VIE36_01545 [Methylomirabilota bacterium]